MVNGRPCVEIVRIRSGLTELPARHLRLPQVQGVSPAAASGICPTSPAHSDRPRCSRPDRIKPTPIPVWTRRTSSESTSGCSCRVSRAVRSASFSTATSMPNRSARSAGRTPTLDQGTVRLLPQTGPGTFATSADDNVHDEILCRAQEQGIVVLTLTINDSEGAEGICRLAFMGPNFVESGYVLGKRIIEEHGIGEGDLVFMPVEAPQATYAGLRQEGVERALAEVGATAEILGPGTGNHHGQALNLMTHYLLGHAETTAVIGLGQTPISQAVQVIKVAGLDIPAGGACRETWPASVRDGHRGLGPCERLQIRKGRGVGRDRSPNAPD